MIDYPGFSELGYQLLRELGRNREGGRIAYLAHALKSNQKVVIKEFKFTGADWFGGKAYERETQILQRLNHARIPRYLDSFETPEGFYLVQEYKDAPSLGLKRCYHPEEIKQIALSILEILVYLQQQVPPIIHRDIKPENILVDEQLNAYLVDFGLARFKGAKTAMSSFVVGTPGFMPPEEHFGHMLTEASDLYSLGATVICLLTNTRAADIGKFIDDKYRFNCQNLFPHLKPRFRLWAIRMVERNQHRRYRNASESLAALKPLQVIGTASWIDHLTVAVASINRIHLIGLAIVGTITLLGAALVIAQPKLLENSSPNSLEQTLN